MLSLPTTTLTSSKERMVVSTEYCYIMWTKVFDKWGLRCWLFAQFFHVVSADFLAVFKYYIYWYWKIRFSQDSGVVLVSQTIKTMLSYWTLKQIADALETSFWTKNESGLISKIMNNSVEPTWLTNKLCFIKLGSFCILAIIFET